MDPQPVRVAPEQDAVCILAGGEATRFPGKLESDAGGVPLLVRVYRNVRSIGPVTISTKGAFAPEVDAALDCPLVIDRWPRRGPLGGLLSTFGEMALGRIFVVAGDLPFVDRSVYERLARAWKPGTEAAIPVHGPQGDERVEPLCALYDRDALLREGYPIFTSGSGSVKGVVERLRATLVRFDDARIFANVNAAADRRVFSAMRSFD